MEINQNRRIIKGKHKNEDFTYEDGYLTMFNIQWSKEKIKTLIETANLLHLEGYELQDKFSMTQSNQKNSFYKFLYDIDPGYPMDEGE